MWITNGLQADWCCLLANTSDGPVHKNKSLIIVPMDAAGITKQKIKKIGMNSSDTAQLFFDNVKVPRRHLIGQEGMGFAFQMLQFQEERLFGAASSLKGMDALIDQTIEYTRQRKAFGKSILDNQVVHFRLAELRTEVEALRALTYRAVEMYVGGKDVTKLASMAKLKCGRLTREVADSCLQYWGGMGFTWDNPISQAYRDSRLVSIGGGADEIMLGIIAKLRGHAAQGARVNAPTEPPDEHGDGNPAGARGAAGVWHVTPAAPKAATRCRCRWCASCVTYCDRQKLPRIARHRCAAPVGTSAAAATCDMAAARASTKAAIRCRGQRRLGELCGLRRHRPGRGGGAGGLVMGGGFGLACVADSSHRRAERRVPPARTSLGVVPAQIAPFLVERLALTRRGDWPVTGGKLDADAALRLGLVHGCMQAAAHSTRHWRTCCTRSCRTHPARWRRPSG